MSYAQVGRAVTAAVLATAGAALVIGLAAWLRITSSVQVTVAQALHWFDLPRFFGEARRVLAPDGRVLARSRDDEHWTPQLPSTDEIARPRRRRLRPPAAGSRRGARRTRPRTER